MDTTTLEEAMASSQLDKTTVESDVGSPPFTEDDRRSRPALQEEHSSGGREESKLDGEEVSLFLPEVIDRACHQFAKFWNISRAIVDETMINKHSPSLGIAGWSDPEVVVLDYEDIRREKLHYEKMSRQDAGWNLGSDGEDHAATEARNAQVARLINTLGESGAGKRAVLKAIAERQGVVDPDELEKLYEGKSDVKLHVPQNLRMAMSEIGLGNALAPVNLITTRDTQPIFVNEEAWNDLEFEVALDSGSVVHVCSIEDCPGYNVGESPGSRRGQEFLMGDGGTIPNLGQSRLNLTDKGIGKDIESVFQIAAVTRPLMSVGRICDEGHKITFDAVMAVVMADDGTEICRFHRNDSGLYVAKLKLRSPASFGRQE